MSLPYFGDNGWNAEVVIVDEQYADFAKDPLLLQTIPKTIRIHKVKSFDKNGQARSD